MKKKKGKSKDTRAAAKKRKHQELKGDMLEKMEKLGLNYHDDEIPPDEVDQATVAKPLLHTLKALIPYTQEWYQSNEAEDEMDDFRALQVEAARARNLVTLTKIGQHEDALDIMMADTNHDFHYFNKMKAKALEEGKFKLDLKLKARQPARPVNKLQGAVDAALPMYGGDTSDTSTAFQLAVDLTGSASTGCVWRGKDASGVPLKCSNAQMVDPRQRKKSNKEPDDLLSYCVYHNLYCIGDHDGSTDVTIKFPNKETFCTECYMAKHKKQPAKLPAGLIPGVVNATTGKALGGAVVDDDDVDGQEDEVPVCGWKPDKEEALTEKRGYICKNPCYRDPATKALHPTCPMHIKKCVKVHTNNDGKVEVRNVFGLCSMHHIAEHGDPPTEILFPYPGMERRLKSKGWKIKPGHFFAPTWPRKDDIVYRKQYVPPPEAKTFIEKIRVQAKVIEYKKKIKALGLIAATIIQKYFRRYLVLGTHRNLIFVANMNKRTKSALIVQSLGRRYIDKKTFLNRRARDSAAAVNIQRVYRGHVGRVRVGRWRAAAFIQKSFRSIRSRKFQQAVMAVISIKRLLRKKGVAVVSMQRVIRGFCTRNKVVRYLQFLVNQSTKSSIIVSRALRRYRDMMWRVRNPPKNLEAIKRFKLGLRIGHYLKRVYFNYVRRKELTKLKNEKAVILQRNIRRFCGQAIFNNLKFLREALQNWCKPEFAVEFLQEQMTKKVPMCKYGLPVVRSGSGVRAISAASGTSRGSSRTGSRGGSRRAPRIRGPICIRGHMDPADMAKPQVDKKIFEAALRSYYKENGYHFAEAEYEAIVKTFKDLSTSKIDMVLLDSYVSLHKEACTLHGRNICGACYFFKECGFRKCNCQCFEADTLGNILNCSKCHHSNVLHRKYPSQLKHENRFRGLKMTLTSSKRPDIEQPVNVTGVQSTSVDLYEKPAVVKRPGTRDSNRSRSTNHSEMVAREQSALTTTLSTGHALGSTMADPSHIRDYWGQDELAISINGSQGFYLPGDHGISLGANQFEPNVDLTTNEFWKQVPKNPNKSVRDYNEKFDHNMPMPIVANGELVYTIEGAKAYVMLLTRLIYIGEHGLIHHDSGDLLRLIVDHMQLFERHWRKMVVDIRNGTLNRHCMVSKAERTEFESSNLPRPKISKTLDDTFRKLGFHMKVLGKDITEKPFAERKELKHTPPAFEERGSVEESLTQFRLKSRRLSTPIESIEGLIQSDMRAQSGASSEFDGTASMGWQASRGSSRGSSVLSFSGKFGLRDRASSPSELSLLRAISRGGEIPTSRQGSTRASSRDCSRESHGIQTLNVSKKNTPLKPISPSKSKRVSFVTPSDNKAHTADDPFVVVLDSRSSRDVNEDTTEDNVDKINRALSLESTATSTSAHVNHSTKTTGPSMRALAKTVGLELVAKIVDFEDSKNIRGPSRRISSKGGPKISRRGSDTDILRPATAQNLHDISYQLETDPRSSYERLVKSGERYLCPFPSCGASFTSMQATFDHLKDHEQKTLLFGSAPGQDAHMHFYWPDDAPWRGPEWFNKKGTAAGSLGCTQCDEAFPTKDKLDIHVRLNHNKKPPKELPRHIECVGKPSTQVPEGIAFLDQCVRHLYFLKNCPVCVRCELNEGVPKPKFKFFKSIRINFTVLKGSGGSSLLTVGDSSKGVIVKMPDHSLDSMNSASFSSDGGDEFPPVGASAKKKKNSTLRGIVQGIVVDAEKDPWVCISRLITAKEARAEGVQISRLFDHDYELLQMGLQNVWYRAADIVDRFSLCYCTKIEFKKKLKNGEIPSDNIYFVRTEDTNAM